MRRGSVRAASLAARRAFGQGIAPRAPGKATRQVQHSKSDGRRGHKDRATSSSRSGLVTNSSPTRRHRAEMPPRPPAPPRRVGVWAHVVDTGGAQIMRHVSLTSTIPTGHARLEHAVQIPSDFVARLHLSPGFIYAPSTAGSVGIRQTRSRRRHGQVPPSVWAHAVLEWPVALGMAVPMAVVRPCPWLWCGRARGCGAARVKLAALRVKVPALPCEWKCPRCRIHIGIHLVREFTLPDITLT